MSMMPALPPGWRAMDVPNPATSASPALRVLLREHPSGAADLFAATPVALLAAPALRDAGCSATIVLSAAPSPTDRLGELIEHAALALDVDLTPPTPVLAALGAETAVVDRMRVSLRRGSQVVASSVTATGPFPRAALATTLAADDARALLDAVTLHDAVPAPWKAAPLELMAEVRPVASASIAVPTVRVRVALHRAWSSLDGMADEDRTVRERDLLGRLPAWMAAGVVTVLAGPADPATILPAVLRGLRPVLRPVAPADGQPAVGEPAPGESPAGGVSSRAYAVTAQAPLAQEVTAATPAGTVAGVSESAEADGELPWLRLSVPLAEALAPALDDGIDRVVQVITVAGGRWTGLLPVRQATPRDAPGRRLTDLRVAVGGEITAVPGLVDRRWPDTAVDVRPDQPWVTDLVVLPNPADRRPGPLLDDAAEVLWPDRFDSESLWYLPAFEAQLPDPAMSTAVDTAPFRFDIVAEIGHTVDGLAAVTASVVVTLAAVRPQFDVAIAAAGRATLRPVALTVQSVSLGVPYRDDTGATGIQEIVAESIDVSPMLADGSGLVDRARLDGAVRATFRLTDRWARLAYGALSTPGFQTQETRVSVGVVVEGWRRQRLGPLVAVDGKRWAVPPGVAMSVIRAAPFAVQPVWSERPELLSAVRRAQFAWSRLARSRQAPLLAACSRFGAFYREQVGDSWAAIGCRPAFQLGEARPKPYEQVDVTAAQGWATVYRSTLSPGRFLVVPSRFGVARGGPADGERAYRPKLLLCSAVDAQNPSLLRCLLAGALEPDLPPYVRSSIRAELGRIEHPAPHLEWWPPGSGDPTIQWALPAGVDVDTVLESRGLSVVLSCDLAGFLVLKTMLERGGVIGSMSLPLPGDVVISSTLALGTGVVVGPFDTGPVVIDGDAAGTVTLVNRTSRRIAVTALAATGEPVLQVGRILEPAASVPVDVSPAALIPGTQLDVVHTVEAGAEQLDEVRAYIEDLRVNLAFVASGDLTAAGISVLEVRTQMLDREDPEPLRLTADMREQRREYLLPLTVFVADPILRYEVTSVAVDGTRHSAGWETWAVRSRGAIVVVAAPDG
ncbi:hypothetical protein ACWDG1_46160 [Streptomyces sp. NPDC001177]